MPTALRYHLRVEGATALVRVGGTLTFDGVFHVLRACRRAPAHVRTLHVQLDNVRVEDPGAVGALAAIVAGWRCGAATVFAGVAGVDAPRGLARDHA